MTNTPPDKRPLVSANIVTRVLTAIVGFPILFGLVYSGGTLFQLLAAFFAVVGSLEFAFMVTERNFRPSMLVCGVLGAAIVLTFPEKHYAAWAVSIGLAAILLLIIEYVQDENRQQAFKNALWMLLLSVYVSQALAFGVVLRDYPGGLGWWLLALFASWMTDTMALVGGRAFGKRKLAPTISPKKTVEGAITGVLSSLAVQLFMLAYTHALIPILIFIVLCGPFISIIGDLSISKVKRLFKIKDSALPYFNVVPGHGGLLDRIDSVLLVLYFYYLAIQAYHLLQS